MNLSKSEEVGAIVNGFEMVRSQPMHFYSLRESQAFKIK